MEHCRKNVRAAYGRTKARPYGINGSVPIEYVGAGTARPAEQGHDFAECTDTNAACSCRAANGRPYMYFRK